MHRQRVFIWNWKYVESMNAFCTWFVLGRQFIFTFHVRPHLYTCALQMALFMNLTQKNMPAFSRIMRSKRELEYMYESSMQQLLVEVLLMYSPSNFFFEKKRKVNSHGHYSLCRVQDGWKVSRFIDSYHVGLMRESSFWCFVTLMVRLCYNWTIFAFYPWFFILFLLRLKNSQIRLIV